VTQQNAALVEEAAAAAESLQDQAHHLAQVVGVFKLGEPVRQATATKAGAAPPSKPPAPSQRLASARSAATDEWETF